MGVVVTVFTALKLKVKRTWLFPPGPEMLAPVEDTAAKCATPEPSLIVQPVPTPFRQLAKTVHVASAGPSAILTGLIAAGFTTTKTSKKLNDGINWYSTATANVEPVGCSLAPSTLSLGELASARGKSATVESVDESTSSARRNLLLTKLCKAFFQNE